MSFALTFVLAPEGTDKAWRISSRLLAAHGLVFDPLLSHSQITPPASLPPLLSTFISPSPSPSQLFLLHLSSSQLAYALSSSSLSIPGCLSAGARLPLISLLRRRSCPESSPPHPRSSSSLSPSSSLTLKYQERFLNHSLVVSIPPSIPPSWAPLKGSSCVANPDLFSPCRTSRS